MAIRTRDADVGTEKRRTPMTFAAMENEGMVIAMRLIDADVLELRYEFGYDHYGILCVPLRDVNESIKKAKTVDAVPIVR